MSHTTNRGRSHQWYFMKNSLMGEQQVGPISEELLKQKALEGELKPNTKIFSPTRTKGKWVYAKNISGVLQLIVEGNANRTFEKNEAKKHNAAQDNSDHDGWSQGDSDHGGWKPSKLAFGGLLFAVLIALPFFVCYGLLENFGFAVFFAVLPFLISAMQLGLGKTGSLKLMLGIGMFSICWFCLGCIYLDYDMTILSEFRLEQNKIGVFQFTSVAAFNRAFWIVRGGHYVIAGCVTTVMVAFCLMFFVCIFRNDTRKYRASFFIFWNFPD